MVHHPPEKAIPGQCLSATGRSGVVRRRGRIGSEIALTHDGDGTVVALDIHGVEDETAASRGRYSWCAAAWSRLLPI